MKIIETRPRKKIGFVLWGHCQNLLDDPRNINVLLYGNDSFDNTLNSTFFRAVHGYIKSTKCFDNTCSYFLYLIRTF